MSKNDAMTRRRTERIWTFLCIRMILVHFFTNNPLEAADGSGVKSALEPHKDVMRECFTRNREYATCSPFQELHGAIQSTISRSPRCVGNRGSTCALIALNQQCSTLVLGRLQVVLLAIRKCYRHGVREGIDILSRVLRICWAL